MNALHGISDILWWQRWWQQQLQVESGHVLPSADQEGNSLVLTAEEATSPQWKVLSPKSSPRSRLGGEDSPLQ